MCIRDRAKILSVSLDGARPIGLAPSSETERIFANQLQLTITDLLMEVHDTHHPISNALYYEEQKEESVQRASGFIDNRVPKYMNYFEKVLKNNPSHSGWLIGDKMTYVDLSLFQVVQGLRYAFPKGFEKYEKRSLSVLSLDNKILSNNKVSEYLSSDRSCLLYTSPSPRDRTRSRMPSSA